MNGPHGVYLAVVPCSGACACRTSPGSRAVELRGPRRADTPFDQRSLNGGATGLAFLRSRSLRAIVAPHHVAAVRGFSLGDALRSCAPVETSARSLIVR